MKTKKNIKPPRFDSTKTAKSTCFAKAYTNTPSFWLERKIGTRTTPLTNGNHAKIFMTVEELISFHKKMDNNNLVATSIRERWINKIFHRCVKKNGYRQIIVLGSGFDIKAVKKNKLNQTGKKNAAIYSETRFFEIDRSSVLDEKEKFLAEYNIDKNSVYIRADYITDDFIDQLGKEGVNFSAPSLVIWEGNWMFLENIEVEKTLEKLKQAFSNFIIAFDYCSQVLIDRTAAEKPIWQERKSGIDDVYRFAGERGFSVVESTTVEDLAKEYKVYNSPPDGMSEYSFCTLKR